ncbi:MAG TPA: right-handed parallel beta-helix repeat-containing protein [Candidatus Eisenbacteria bacterium]|nr:right-handed parallel beta-helix repeat-containing protein [Candidatus Eisenbacteria bacterium]
MIENGGGNYFGEFFNLKCYDTIQPTIDNCTIRRSAGYGMRLGSANLTVTATAFSENGATDVLCLGTSNPTLTNCSFATGSHLGVDVDTDASSSTPALSGCTFSGSGAYALRVPPMSVTSGSITLTGYTVGVRFVLGTVSTNRTWGALGGGLVYEFESPVTVLNGATLTVEPGATLKFEAGAGVTVGHPNGSSTGSLMAVGTAGSPIVFTSVNGAPGGWLGIVFPGSSTASQMSYCVIENGGGNYFGQYFNIKSVGTSQPALSNCVIRNSAGWGIFRQASGTVTASSCAFVCNASGAVSSDASGSVVATSCWWGDPSGPSDPSTGAPDYNPGGQGQSVTDNVTYRPWLTGSPGFIESAIAKRWSGLGDGTTWNDPANWLGGVRPGSIDRVLFDNSQAVSSYQVQLPPGNTTTIVGRVTIAPAAGQTITLVLPAGNTAMVAMQVDDLNSEADDIVVQTGGALKNASGASSGNGIAGNPLCSARIRIENGGRYVHATSLDPAGILAMMSQAAGTERGEFVYDVPGTGTVAIAADGRTYGSLVLARSAGPATYTASGGNDLTVRGDFRVESGITYASTMTAPMHVGGHWTNDGAPLTLSATQSVVFDGLLGPQTISGSAATTWNGGASVAATAVVTIASGATVEIGAPLANGGSLSVAGTLQVNEGGSASGNEFVYSPTGTLVCNRSGGSLIIDGAAAMWPSGAGPSNVVVQGAGITVDVARNATNVSLFAPILNAGNLTVNGTALMNAGGSFASAPVYGANATLQYATGDWAPGPEWSSGTSVGSGVPRNLVLTLGAGNELSMPASDRTVPGTLTIPSGTLALNPTSGDLRVGDDVTVLSSGGIATNGRTLILDGGLAGDANIVLDPAGGSLTFDHLQLQNANVSIVPHGWEMVIAPSSGESVRMTGSSSLHLNGTTLRIAGGPSTFAVADGAKTIFGPGNLDLASAVTVVNAGNGGMLVTDGCDNVLRSPTEPGAGLTTVNAGTLTLEAGASVAHAPIYANGVTLIYHDGSFVTGPEWVSGLVEGPGVPMNVTIDAGAGDTVRTQNSPLRVPGNLVILSGTLVGPDTTTIVVGGDCDVGPEGKVSGKGRGHGSSQGPGGPPGVPGGGAGGGAHGGRGGNGSTGQGSTATYDSQDAPFHPGSGGGSSGAVPGGAGGGVVRLVVGGTLTLEGSIDADGEDGAASGSDAGGGGAGGTISITASAIQGNGAVRARGGNGGAAASAYGGGGGGGRIALYHLDPVSGVTSGYIIASLPITVETGGGDGGGGTASAGDAGTTQERQITGVSDPAVAIPSLAFMNPPFPNPTHGTATLVFGLPRAGHLRIEIFDLRGARVRTLLDAERPAGTGRVQWDGRDEGGQLAESGVYFARMDADRRIFRTSLRLVR